MKLEEKRRFKHPETAYYCYRNVNPKNKITSDCVYRAIANATGLDYKTVALDMTKLQVETGYDTGENRLIDKYLTSLGWVKMSQPRNLDNTKLTGKEFINKFSKYYKKVILSIGTHHLSCIINGRFEDTWNCSYGKVGIYWVKPANGVHNE